MTEQTPLSPDRRAAGQATDDVDLSTLDEALRTTLVDATDRTKDELRRLASYRAPAATIQYPKAKLAAVLLLLHLNRRGELSVTLTTRSKKLRSHPGETALPGGRWEEGDGEGGVWTALREANEEIGLPLPRRSSVPSACSPTPPSPSSPATRDPPHLLYLTTLPAFTSRTLLVVLPVVYLLLKPPLSAGQWLDETLHLNEDEVDAVFHLPLRSFLMRSSDSPSNSNSNSHHPRARPRTNSETLTHTFQDFTWLLSRPYRLHHFSHPNPLVTPSPVTGLTADIVVEIALVAQPEAERRVGFERCAKGQMRWSEIVEEAVRVHREEGGGGARERGLRGKVARDDERTSAT